MRPVYFTVFILLLITPEFARAACESNPHSRGLLSFALNAEARKVAAAAADGTIVLWDTRSGSEVHLIECYPAPVSTMTFSPDSSLLALGDGHGVITVWNLLGNRLTHKLSSGLGQIEQISFSADGTRMATSDFQGVRVWQLQPEKEISSIPTGAIGSIALNHNGSVIAVAGYGTMGLFGVSNGQPIRKMAIQHDDWIDKTIFARNDQWIISAQGRKGIVVWDANTGREVKTLQGSGENAFIALVSPDRNTLLCMGDDGTVRSWDLETGQIKSTWKRSPGVINADGRFLLSPVIQPGTLELQRIGSSIKETRSFTYESPLCGKLSIEEDHTSGSQLAALQNIGTGESKAGDGTHLSFNIYVTRDCTSVTVTSGDFVSEQSALNELNYRVQKALRVIERGPNKDFLGRTLGERTVLSFSESNGAVGAAAVIWTEGNHYHEILSSSLPVALSLEKQRRQR